MRAFCASALRAARFASAWRTAASNGRGSMVNSRSPLFTSCPSRKRTSATCPSTRDLTSTLAKASTVPMARNWTGTSFSTAVAACTGDDTLVSLLGQRHRPP